MRRTVAVLLLLTAGCADSGTGDYRDAVDLAASISPVEPDTPLAGAATGDQTDPDPAGTTVDTGTTVNGSEPTPPADGSPGTDSVSAQPGSEPVASGSSGSGRNGFPETPAATSTGDDPSPAAGTGTPADAPPREVRVLIPEKTFQEEGPEKALRVSFDDIDLLRVLNMEPVTPEAPKWMPGWLKGLDGQRIRLRGFMYPPFQDTGLKAFVLARDNQICCFGRSPKVYDLVSVVLREGVTTDYIEGRPFDVIGVLRIGSSAVPGELYSLEDSIVIAR